MDVHMVVVEFIALVLEVSLSMGQDGVGGRELGTHSVGSGL
jgi:hypothetical protein